MSNNVGIHFEHRKRLRKRYAKEGIDNFEDHEILELLLQFPIRNGDTNEVAHRLINEIGSFSDVFDAEIHENTSVNGIGERSAVFIKLVHDMFDYYMCEKKDRAKPFDSLTEIAEYCAEQYKDITEETYSVMLFDMSDKLLGFETLSNCSYLDYNKIKAAVGRLVFTYNASNFILVRNAVDENLEPSDEEIFAYFEIKDYFRIFNRYLVEYIIITPDKYMPICKYLSKSRN